MGFGPLALIPPQPTRAHRGLPLGGFWLLAAGHGEGWPETGVGLGHIWSGLAQRLQEAVAPGLLPGAAEPGQEPHDHDGRKPDPLRLTAQDAHTRRRKEGVQTNRRDANGTPGEEIPAILKGGEQGYP